MCMILGSGVMLKNIQGVRNIFEYTDQQVIYFRARFFKIGPEIGKIQTVV